ncbi:3-keto-disaccharide hydrolase [Algoriphagus boritolerans]|uniref:3-keto-alpha-glucoside-1,2-lyase/3-keto-2-hydroxy-glucal hydratase domain-containing protein n=1 Tax=Algoriphagus boritolerans DSM 17298 = JCM 18970 TaxID=1120964 RepID=A0A1H5X4H8_9BACT|nr:DUF1080 domain-containing protein [Algoriphagus boritolerans]SEG06247.1 protein of unknown function [Algoriphagus boritolerans DSM 17298 = JCM 18970]
MKLAVIVTVAVLSVGCISSKVENADFESIFDGKTLNGWEYDPVYWTVKDGAMVGEITPETILKNNTFIIWKGGELGDFELKMDYWVSETGNSGVQYRSDRFTEVPFALRGYQADIDGGNRYTGQNYEERKRTTLAYRGQKTRITSQPDSITEVRGYVERNAWKGLNLVADLGDRDQLGALIKKGDWNNIHLVIKGNLLRHYVNGTLMSEVTDDDTKNRMMKGLIGMQVHVGPPMKVMFKNIELKRL